MEMGSVVEIGMKIEERIVVDMRICLFFFPLSFSSLLFSLPFFTFFLLPSLYKSKIAHQCNKPQ